MTARSSMVPTDWNVSPRARDLFREAGNRRVADEGEVAERMVGEPRIDELALELGPCLGRHGDRTADLPHLIDESTRDRDGFGLERAEGAGARAVAEELIHLACEDPRVDEGADRLQPEARLSHLGDGADPPEQGVAPDCRIGGPLLDRRGREVDFRGERDRVLVHARPQRFDAEVGPDFRPGLQVGSATVSSARPAHATSKVRARHAAVRVAATRHTS